MSGATGMPMPRKRLRHIRLSQDACSTTYTKLGGNNTGSYFQTIMV